MSIITGNPGPLGRLSSQLLRARMPNGALAVRISVTIIYLDHDRDPRENRRWSSSY
jgi:hypothetical protein